MSGSGYIIVRLFDGRWRARDLDSKIAAYGDSSLEALAELLEKLATTPAASVRL